MATGIESTLINTGPGTTGVVKEPSQPDWKVHAAKLQAEYVSGGGYAFLANFIRALPQYIDDVTRDFGDDLYNRMLLDPQVNSCIRILIIAALEDGIELDPAIKHDAKSTWNVGTEGVDHEVISADTRQAEIDDKDAALADEICEWWRDSLSNLDRPLMEVMYEVGKCIAVGNKVGELIWEQREDDNGNLRMTLKNIKVKPRSCTAFVVDSYMNCIGLVGLIPGQGWPVQAGTIIGDPSRIPNLLPVEKFLVMTWGSSDGDPRGNSLCRPAYNAWYSKMQIWAQWMLYLAWFASPKVIGKTGPGATHVPAADSLGNVIPGGAQVTAESVLRDRLLDFANGMVIAVPNGTDVQVVTASGAGNSIYISAINLCDLQIAKGILCQTLATELHQHQGRAASSTHQDILDEVVVHLRMLMTKALQQQVLYRGTLYNWGKQVADRMTPNIRSQQVEGHDWASRASAVGTLTSTGFLDQSQYAELDAQLGLPARATPPDTPATPEQPADDHLQTLAGMQPDAAGNVLLSAIRDKKITGKDAVRILGEMMDEKVAA